MSANAPSVFDLDPSEKLQLVEDLWDDLAATPETVPVHDWQKTEFTPHQTTLQHGETVPLQLAERGTMFTTHIHYMQKLVVGRRSKGVIDLNMPVEWNLIRIAKAEGLPPQELTVVVLERQRNEGIVAEIRDVGARIKLIPAGDVGGALEAALDTRYGIHCMMGSGGSTEGVLAACAIKAIGGDMQAKLLIRDDAERKLAIKEGHQPDKVLSIDNLCSGNNIFFAATGITSGELLKGVRYDVVYAFTQSMVLRSASGTMRIVDAYHPIDKLRVKELLPEQVVARPGTA